MKILQIIPHLCTGGAEKFTIDLSNELSRIGHEVILVTLFDKNERSVLEGYVDSNKIERICLHKNKGLDFRCFISLLSLIKEERPDIVHSHIGAIKYMVLAATFYRKCKYIATIHSDAKREAGRGIELIARKYMFGFGLMQPVTISNESERSFKNFYGFDACVIPNGCSSYKKAISIYERKYKHDVDFLFVHAGRMQKVKNQIVMVKAFRHLLDDGIKAKLLIMGRKENTEIFETISPFFCDGIEYIGEQKDCRLFMAMADAFCLTSLMEGMPISIIEAFSVGCVPIVTPVGGCVNMIKDGWNGLLSIDTTAKDYYKALKKYVSLTDDERNVMRVNAIRTFDEEYSISNCATKYLELYYKQ